MYAEVALNIPMERTFTYSIPKDMTVHRGNRVKIPFGKKSSTGIVIRITEKEPSGDYEVKPVEKVFPDYFDVDDIQFELARRIHLYYLASYNQSLFEVAGAFKDVRISEQKYKGDPQSRLLLNSEQNSSIRQIHEGDDRIYLIHGVTGSGKTEIYFQLIDYARERNGQTLYLLPEIALTPQVVKRFTDRYGEKIAVFNSGLSNGKRNYAINAFRNGDIDVLVGTRSSIFLPAGDLELIIIDEEHEHTFKQSETPCYDAKKVAEWRCELEGAKLVMGSATPSVEAMFNARRGKYKLVEVLKRSDGRPMPQVKLIDMKGRQRASHNISQLLSDKIEKRLNSKEQVLLFHNRRGFSSFLICDSCGHVVKCRNCDISLNYHKYKDRMICHYCNYQLKAPKTCPECGSNELDFMGAGTERIEEEVRTLFPQANVIRIDRDTSGKKDFFWDFYNEMHKGNIDIVIGTQMIGKGFDFSGVTLVGVLWADFILDMPDFRSSERTAQLLNQVAGRSGRTKEGEVIIQTWSPEHYAINSVVEHNYTRFFSEEISRRKMLGFPPFCNMARLLVMGKKKIFNRLPEIEKRLRSEMKDIEILGPAPAAIPFLRGMHRYNFIFRFRHGRKHFNKVLLKVLQDFSDLKYRIDIDPLDMM